MTDKLVRRQDLLEAFKQAGLKRGDTVMVHASLKSLGYVCGGAHPARSVAAWGRHAEYLTADHDLCNIFGDGSPLSRLYDLDGRVLLMGVGHDKNTSLHLADARAQYPGKHTVTEHSAVMENGRRVWRAYDTLYVDGEDFKQLGAAFEGTGAVKTVPLGCGEIRLMSQRQLVDFAVGWIEKNRK